MATLFSSAVWLGGFYELAMEFPSPSQELLQAAVRAVWSVSELNGCYLQHDVPPCNQHRVLPELATQVSSGHLRGVAMVPGGLQVACGTCLVREHGGSTWLVFYLPMGSLTTAYDVKGYPFDDQSNSRAWREPLEQWLVSIGREVFSKAAFSLGLIGFEVSGTATTRELSVQPPPEERSIGYLVPSDNRLIWYPTNRWGP